MAHYVEIKIYRRKIIVWNYIKGLFQNSPNKDKWEPYLDNLFVPRFKKYLYKKKRKIKCSQIRNLNYLGISDYKLLKNLVKADFNRFLDDLDKTEEAIKSKKEIFIWKKD